MRAASQMQVKGVRIRTHVARVADQITRAHLAGPNVGNPISPSTMRYASNKLDFIGRSETSANDRPDTNGASGRRFICSAS